MKYLLHTILCLAVLCMAGCSKEEPDSPSQGGGQQEVFVQSVKFSQTSLSIGRGGGTLEVSVVANCNWTISKTGGNISLSKSTGINNDTISVTVSPNSEYDETKSTLTITSQDKKSSFTLTITQGEGLGLKVEAVDTIDAGGGDFSLFIHTNDHINPSEMPEWIRAVESKALRDSVMLFSVDPNRSGAVREALLKLQGDETEQGVRVVQHSYTPTSVEVSIPDSIANSDDAYSYDIRLVPEYADWSKLSVETSGGTAEIKDGKLMLSVPETGECEVKVTCLGQELYKHKADIYDGSYPVSVEINMPELLCDGRHAFHIKVFPETADVSNLGIATYSGGKFSIEGDSLIANIDKKPSTRYVVIASNGKIVFYRDFKVISRSAMFNLEDGDDFLVGDNFMIEPEIPLDYARFYTSDESVAKVDWDGFLRFIGPGDVDVTMVNTVSKERRTVNVECKRMDGYATISIVNVLGREMVIDLYLKAYKLGKGVLYMELDGNNKPITIANLTEVTSYGYGDPFHLVQSDPPFGPYEPDRENPTMFRVVFDGLIDGVKTRLETEWKKFGKP